MIAKDQLQYYVNRIEKLTDEKDLIASDIRDLFKEASGAGFDQKALRAIIKLRRQDAAEREAQSAILETYMHALGMLSDLPLGQAAIARASDVQRTGAGVG